MKQFYKDLGLSFVVFLVMGIILCTVGMHHEGASLGEALKCAVCITPIPAVVMSILASVGYLIMGSPNDDHKQYK